MTDDIAEKGIEKLAEKAFEFIGQVVNPPLSELGGLFADEVKFFRFKNQVNIVLKAEKFLQEKGIEPGKIPLKTLAPLINNCSWEEDEDMQKRWATLLANAATLNENMDNYTTYVELLRQLSPLQAKCLDIMYNEENYPARRYARALPSYQPAFYLRKSLKISKEDLYILFDSLIRLNLIHADTKYKQDRRNP